MSWLNHIDYIYKRKKESHYIRDYLYYFDHTFKSNLSGLEYVLVKRNKKTKLILKDNVNRVVYLSDIDIIQLLCEIDLRLYELLISYFKEFLASEQGKILDFKLEGSPFSFPLIYPPNITDAELDDFKNSTIYTDADLLISIDDLVFLMSFIIEKEFLAPRDPKEKKKRKYRQIKKFLILSGYYRLGHFEEELKSIGYPVGVPKEHVYHRHINVSKFDKIFDSHFKLLESMV